MLWRAQVVLAHNNGLPRDAVTNTFHFTDSASAPSEAAAEPVAEMVRDFYVTAFPPAVQPLSYWFSRSIAGGGHQVKMTPINPVTGEDFRGQGYPPVWIENFDLVGRALPGTATPAEVAVCLSYRDTDSSGVPPARRRGRIYFGPLRGDGISTTESLTGRAAVNFNLVEGLLAAGDWLKAPGRPADWVVYSRPYPGRGPNEEFRANGTPLPAIPARPGATYLVDEVFVDDAFDTQRRRGERAITRTFS